MKKGFLVVLIFALMYPVFSQKMPESLKGIWEGKDRFIYFEDASDDENPELVVILKEFYGWYYDRASEPSEYNQIEKRIRNDATHIDAEFITYEIENLSVENAYQMTINYSKSEKNYVPFAIIDDKIYLDFYTKVPVKTDDENEEIDYQLYKGYLQGQEPTFYGFRISQYSAPENVGLLIIDDNKMYDVRYWLTDMEYDDDFVIFKYKDDSYNVPKHLIVGNQKYSCVNGRSRKVRNTMPFTIYDENEFIFNEDKSILIKNPEPYLLRRTIKRLKD